MNLLVGDPDARSRLRAVAALRTHHTVLIPEPGERVVRAARRLGPQLVLLAMPRARMREAFRTARALKTDGGTAPIVGLTDRWARLRDPQAALQSCMADGYLGGTADPEAILAFVRALVAGQRPITQLEAAESGLLGKLFGR